MEIMYILFAVFCSLQILDFISTKEALKKDNVYEANPIMKFLMDKIGIDAAMILIKGVMIFVVWHYLFVVGPIVLGLVCALYAFVVYNNFKLAK